MKAKKPSVRDSAIGSLKKGGAPVRPAGQMPVIHSHAAGIDIGATMHWVCVPEDSVAVAEKS